ncbi:hypothetical protein [Eubacterium oxidoreducens]|nr:hypothetical protein [Eubacterium oxidoreducens]
MGNYKTGTSALQQYLSEHAKEISRQGIYYGKEQKELYFAHAFFACAVLKQALKGQNFWAKEPKIWERIQRSGEELLQEMVQEARKMGCHTVVISQEGILCELLRTLGGLWKSQFSGAYDEDEMLIKYHKTMYELLRKSFDEIEALIFLRRQDEYLESQYKQYIKWPWKEDAVKLPEFSEFVALRPVRLHYKPVLDILAFIYGKDALRVMGYGEKTDTVEEIIKLLKLQRKEEKTLKNSNPSLNMDATEFRRKYIKPEAIYNEELLQVLLEYSKEHPQPELTYIKPQMWQQLKETYEKENRQIAEQYMTPASKPIPPFEWKEKTLYKGLKVEQLEEIFGLFR